MRIGPVLRPCIKSSPSFEPELTKVTRESRYGECYIGKVEDRNVVSTLDYLKTEIFWRQQATAKNKGGRSTP